RLRSAPKHCYVHATDENAHRVDKPAHARRQPVRWQRLVRPAWNRPAYFDGHLDHDHLAEHVANWHSIILKPVWPAYPNKDFSCVLRYRLQWHVPWHRFRWQR